METFSYLHLYAFNEQEEISEIIFNPGKGLAALVLTGASLFVGVQPSQAYAVRPGSVGPAVVDLQVQLNQSGIPVAVDGVFGPQTLAAVLQLQTFYGLAPDGVVGVETRNVLCNCGSLGVAPVSANNFLPPDAYSGPYNYYSPPSDIYKNWVNWSGGNSSSADVTYSPPSDIYKNGGDWFGGNRGNSSPHPQQANVSPRLQSASRVAQSPQFYDIQPAAAAEPATVRQEVYVEPETAQEFLAQEAATPEASQPYVSEDQQMREMLTQGQLEGRLW